MTMKIVFLAHNLVGQGGLIGGQNFINALARGGYDHQYLITVPQDRGYESICLPEHSSYYVCPPTNTLSFRQRYRLESKVISGVIRDFKADAVMGLGNHGMTDIDCPQAIWVRNGYLVYPYKHFKAATLRMKINTLLQRIHFARALKKTGLLFCQTPVMKQRIADYYAFDKNRIEILPNALSEFISDVPSCSAEVPEGIEPGKFNCLVLSQYFPHKNPEIILAACRKYAERLQGIRFITTIGRQDNPRAHSFMDRLERDKSISSLISNVGRIPHDRLLDYYSNVQLVIMPTMMESFSVTYLEAMHFGVPILTSDLDFARYLCGKAAAYYDPWSIDDFVEHLLGLRSDTSLRESLVDNGKTQLSQFRYDWNDMVRVAIEGLERLVRDKGR